MLKIGDKVKYRDLTGDVKSVMDDMVIVKLPDGKEYSLPYDAVKLDGVAVLAPANENQVMSMLRPLVKNVNFLNEFAAMIYAAGVNELHIKLGSIQAFSAKESLDELKAKYKAEAIAKAVAEAEGRAIREFEANILA